MEALAVAAWMEQTGGLKKDAKDIQLYAKPEDSMLYYVIKVAEQNGSVSMLLAMQNIAFGIKQKITIAAKFQQ